MRFHIVGIGGAGMSAIARILLVRGHTVTGSDTGPWPLAMALARDGATVYQRFDPMNVVGAEVVIRSSAYAEDNPEVRAALDTGVTVWKREDAWRFLTKGQRVVAIAGTHGKSTTTAMAWSALRAGGIDASLICGATLRDLGTNAYSGKSDVFVIEADEYDNAFLALEPEVAVVTSLDHDHVDVFPTSESYRDAFQAFARGVRPRGHLIVCVDGPGGRALATWATHELAAGVTKTYGSRDADTEVREDGPAICKFDRYQSQRDGGRIHVQARGQHNCLNATAALLVAESLKLPMKDVVSRGIELFTGVERRLEVLGAAGDITVVDDYAHHPAEIAVGLETFGDGAVLVFQPHTPSRLAAFFDDFVLVLRRARAVVIVETFRSAREEADAHGRARKLAEAVGGRYAPDGETAARIAAELARPGDAVLVMGAGDVRPVGERVLELLRTPV
jgi:UDP-N-acetylmuramate--alanine ligase